MQTKRKYKSKTQKKRNMKGGFLGFFESNSEQYAPKKSWSDWLSGITSSAKSSFQDLTTTQTQIPGQYQSPGQSPSQPYQSPSQPYQSPGQSPYQSPAPYKSSFGGKKSRKLRKRRNIKQKGGTNLAYNAETVKNVRVAEPTYWIKGGTRRHKK
jgi:hypothetical protein